MRTRPARRRLRWLAPALVAAAAALTALTPPLRDAASHLVHEVTGQPQSIQGSLLTAFPEVAVADPARARIVAAARRQYDAQHPGTFYAQGTRESWCADFVSWVLRDAGQPLDNPNSGSWRIPGVSTLQEYYEAAGRFRPVGSGYRPQPGDVVMYSAASPFHQHTNIVLADDAGVLTTVGGNELGRISLHRFTLANDPGALGFGTP